MSLVPYRSCSSRVRLPNYAVMITDAIRDLKDAKGSSKIAIKKYIEKHYDVQNENFNTALKNALRRLVETDVLVGQYKLTGKFKINKEFAMRQQQERMIKEKKPKKKMRKKTMVDEEKAVVIFNRQVRSKNKKQPETEANFENKTTNLIKLPTAQKSTPLYSEMIIEAVTKNIDAKGTGKTKIKKYFSSNYGISIKKINSEEKFNKTLEQLVAVGILQQGTGANGKYKLNVEFVMRQKQLNSIIAITKKMKIKEDQWKQRMLN